MANKISALVFDAYGTLFDVHSVTETCERLFPGMGGSLSQLWRTKQLEYTWQRSLMGRYADFSRVTEDGLRYACGALALRYSQGALDTLMQAYRHLQPFPMSAQRSVRSRVAQNWRSCPTARPQCCRRWSPIAA